MVQSVYLSSMKGRKTLKKHHWISKWNKIEDLKELVADHINAPISEKQCINIALRKLINLQVFNEEVKKWKNLERPRSF